MAPQLPLELENEILTRLPPQSLVRCRTVCKRWNSLLKDKKFVKNHLSSSHPLLIFQTNGKAYLIDVIALNPKSSGPRIDLSDLPYFDLPLHDRLVVVRTCDEFLFCTHLHNKVMGFWNPLLKQWLECENNHRRFHFLGLGYDDSKPEKAYKVLGLHCGTESNHSSRVAIYDCASQVYKFIDKPENMRPISEGKSIVSLNGNLYWLSCNRETQKWFIRSFDFSMETFKPFSLLPCQKSHEEDERLVLAAFKGDRVSLLNLPYRTKEIEIWVTKNKICREEKDVVWIKLMTLPITAILPSGSISYFIYDKTLFMCCGNHGGSTIYIVREDLCKRIQIDSSGAVYCRHSFYTPSLISVPYFRG